jgi:membrane-bound lytic murein transglycosylase D
VKVPSYLPVSDLIQQLELDTDVIKSLNPALLRVVWSGKKYVPKGYQLRLPATTENTTVTALLTRVQGHAQQIPDLFYQVQAGDTLSGIALRHKHSVRDLMALNNLSSKNRVLAGQSLRLSATALPEAIQIASMESVQHDGEPVLPPASGASDESVATAP